MKKIILISLAILLMSGCVSKPSPQNSTTPGTEVKTAKNEYFGKKILVINSYHEDYEGYELKIKGVKSVLDATGLELKIIHLDEKNYPEEKFQKQAALKAKAVIEDFKPDVVITLDDPAFQYVIMPYYKDADLPVVFSGINWDVTQYDNAPYKNTAGMVEVALVNQLISNLKEYANGDRIGFLEADTLSAHKNADAIKQYIKKDFSQQEHAKTFAEWKDKFIEIQKSSDILLLPNNGGIEGWNDEEAKLFVEENTKIPIGTYNDWMSSYSLLGLMKVTEEQGEYAAKTALKILDGARPSEIPVVENERGEIIINLKIANELGLAIKPALLKNATIIK